MTNAVSNLKNVTIEAVIIRADGTKENLGVISNLSADDKSGNALVNFIKRLGGK